MKKIVYSLQKRHSLTSEQVVALKKFIDSLAKSHSKEKRIEFYKNLLRDKEYTLHFCGNVSWEKMLEENVSEKRQSFVEIEECMELFFRVLLEKKKALGKEKVYSYLRCYCGDDPRDMKEQGLNKKQRAERRVMCLQGLLTNIPKASFVKIFHTLKKGELPDEI